VQAPLLLANSQVQALVAHRFALVVQPASPHSQIFDRHSLFAPQSAPSGLRHWPP
jgi:hypothetical protein